MPDQVASPDPAKPTPSRPPSPERQEKYALIARRIVEELAEKARRRQTITYKDLAAAIGLSHHRPLAVYLEHVRDRVVPPEAPLLTSIVVRGTTAKPGNNYRPGRKVLAWTPDEVDAHKSMMDRVYAWDWTGLEAQAKAFKSAGSDGRQTSRPIRCWIEQYWPDPENHVEPLYVWLQDRDTAKRKRMHAGDRVLFYETGRSKGTNLKGSKTVFASATLTDEFVETSPEEKYLGGKHWDFKRKTDVAYLVPPSEGIPLATVIQVLRYRAWPQRGFTIPVEKFVRLEELLRKHQQQRNSRISRNIREKNVSSEPPTTKARLYQEKVPPDYLPGPTTADPAARLASLEQSNDAHCDILNKLARHLKDRGYTVHSNAHIDLFTSIDEVPWIFEVKSCTETNVSEQIRHGLAQLYEYRYRYRQSLGSAKLCLVLQVPPPESWIYKYLHEDRQIQLCWSTEQGFEAVSPNELSFLVHS